MAQCGQFLAHRFKHSGLGITKVVAPRSGVILAQGVALNLQLPMVVAVTKSPMTSPDGVVHSSSRTAGGVYEDDQTLYLSTEFVRQGDKVLVIDDVLASGKMAAAVVDLVKACGATVAGCGYAAQKSSRPVLCVGAFGVFYFCQDPVARCVPVSSQAPRFWQLPDREGLLQRSRRAGRVGRGGRRACRADPGHQ